MCKLAAVPHVREHGGNNVKHVQKLFSLTLVELKYTQMQVLCYGVCWIKDKQIRQKVWEFGSTREETGNKMIYLDFIRKKYYLLLLYHS
jgi:hypothetical protein